MHLGIDWGTESSKTALWQGDHARYRAGRILSSCVDPSEDSLSFGIGAGQRGSIRDLKQRMLRDPLAYPFWEAQRADSRTSLGELVVLSLVCLIADALREAQRVGPHPRAVELGFSMPNWMNDTDEEHVQAARSFCEAAAVAAHWTASGQALPEAGKAFSREVLRKVVGGLLRELRDSGGMAGYVPNWAASVGSEPPTYIVGDLSWHFIVESCAAGLPYLRASAAESRLRKILVVDVGAGSTDVGYMLRTKTVTGVEKLNYFHPAATLRIAGNALTEELRAFYTDRVGRAVQWDEAEALKLDADKAREWADSERAMDWRTRITKHVADYMRHVNDRSRLFVEPPLEVAVTGGSGVVPGLAKEIVSHVKRALADRGVPGRLKDGTGLMDLSLPGLNFENIGQYGRRAVSFGAADPEIPAFREIPEIGEDPGPPGIERFATRGV